MNLVHVLAAGPVRGALSELAPRFAEETGAAVQVALAGPATVRRRLLSRAAADVVVAPAAAMDGLVREGLVEAASIVPVGAAPLGLALRQGDPAPDVSDEDGIAEAFERADEIHLPDPEEGGTGRTVREMLVALEIHEDVAEALRSAPTGAAALTALAASEADVAVGCAEVAEILGADGVTLLGALSADIAPPLALVAGIVARSAGSEAGRTLVELLAGPQGREVRERWGLIPG